MNKIIKSVKSRMLTMKTVMSWFISNCVFNKSYRGKSIAIIFLQFLGNTVLASSIVSVVFLIQKYNQILTIPLLDKDLVVNQVFTTCMGLIFLAILIGSFLIFWSRSNLISISLDFEVIFSKKATQSAGVIPFSVLKGKTPFSKSVKAFNLCNSKHKAETARALRIFLQITNPAVIFIYSFVALALINPIINVIFLTMVLLSAPLYYWAATRAVKGAVGVAMFRSEANIAWRNKVKHFQNTLDEINTKDANFTSIYNAPVFKNSLIAVSERLTAPVFSQLFANLGLAVAFIGAIILTVHESDFSKSSINTIIFTAILLQLVLTSFRGIIQSATSIMRLFPSIQSCHQAWVSDFSNRKKNYNLQSINIRHSSTKTSLFKLGDKLFIQTDIEIHRYNIGSLLFFLSGKKQSLVEDWITNTIMVRSAQTCEVYLREHGKFKTKLGSTQQKNNFDLVSKNVRNRVKDEVSFCLSQNGSFDYLCTNSPDAYTFFEILNGIDGGKKILFIPLDMYERLIENNHKFTNSIFENLIVFVVGTDLVRHVKNLGAKNAYLINEDKVLRIDTIDQIGPSGRQGVAPPNYEDEDEDEE